MINAGKVGRMAVWAALGPIMWSNFALLDAPTDKPVAKRVKARNSDPTASNFPCPYGCCTQK